MLVKWFLPSTFACCWRVFVASIESSPHKSCLHDSLAIAHSLDSIFVHSLAKSMSAPLSISMVLPEPQDIISGELFAETIQQFSRLNFKGANMAHPIRKFDSSSSIFAPRGTVSIFNSNSIKSEINHVQAIL